MVAGVLLGCLFALLDPSGSRGLTLAARLVFWTAHMLAALGLLALATRWLGRMPRLAALPPLAFTALGGVAGAALFAPVSLLLELPFPLAPDDDDVPARRPARRAGGVRGAGTAGHRDLGAAQYAAATAAHRSSA